MFIEVGISCRFFCILLLVIYMFVSCGRLIITVGEERELIFLLSCNYVVSIRRVFSSTWCLG